jgi:hypothetical protein
MYLSSDVEVISAFASVFLAAMALLMPAELAPTITVLFGNHAPPL